MSQPRAPEPHEDERDVFAISFSTMFFYSQCIDQYRISVLSPP